MKITKQSFCKLSKVSYKELNKEQISLLFSIYNNNEIFILDNYTLVGIITKGDFRRSLNLDKIVINTNFKKVYKDEESKVEQLFFRHTNINNIPVLDSNNKLLYTYSIYREDNMFEDKLYTFISRWLKLKSLEISLESFFTAHKYKNIIIYGDCRLSLRLYEEISKSSNVIIKGIINNNKYQLRDDFDLNITNFSSLYDFENFDDIDVIVICDLSNENYYDLLFKGKKVKTVYIDNLINYLYNYKIFDDYNLYEELMKMNLNNSLYYFDLPSLYNVKNLSKYESELLKISKSAYFLVKEKDKDYYQTIFGAEYKIGGGG